MVIMRKKQQLVFFAWFVLLFFYSPTFAATTNWDFTTSGDYTLSNTAVEEVVGGFGQLRDIPYTVDANSIGLWHLNEASGNAVNAAPNNTLTRTGTVTYSAASVDTGYGTAIDFNGTTGYYTIADASQIGLDITGAISLEAWIRRDLDTRREEVIISKWLTTGNARQYRLYISTTDRLAFQLSRTGTSTVTTVTSTATISVGTWTHVAGVYNGSQMMLYINGVSAATPVSYSLGTSNKSATFRIGRDSGTTYFNGVIEEVRVSNIARSSFFAYSATVPTLQPTTSRGQAYGALLGFSTSEVPNGGSIRYQITNQGTSATPTWYYWNGSAWVVAGAGQYNDTATINTNIASFSTAMGAGTFSFKAFLISSGAQFVQLDNVQLTYSPFTFTQSAYRIGVNTNGITPSAWWFTENTPADHFGMGLIFRLRMNLLVNTAATSTGNIVKLQFASGSPCSSSLTWVDVGAIGAGVAWRGYDNTSVADGVTLPSTLLSTSNVAQSYEESNNSAGNPANIPVGQRGEWDWVIQNYSATASTAYCFRMVNGDGTVLSSYTNYPVVTTATGTFAVNAPTSAAFSAKSFDFNATTNTDNALGPLTVEDDRGGYVGWTVQVTGQDWTSGSATMDYNGNGSTTGQLNVDIDTAGSISPVWGSGTGVSLGSTSAFSSGVATIQVATASSGTGNGQYTISGITLDQFIPAQQTSGNYGTTLTFTLL